jgi:small subunit ribosomal protein S6
METAVNRKLYEGMFLVDSAQAADWDATKTIIENVLKKADAEIVEIKKWDDRRLAYEIHGKGRATYILSYFKVDGEKIQDIEKSVQLSEQIMRVLILSTEQMTAEDMGRDTPASQAEKEAATAEEARAARVAEAAAKAVPMDIGIEADDAAPEAGVAEEDAEVEEPDAEVEDADKSDKPEAAEEAEAGEEPRQSDAGNIGEAPAEAEL